MTTPERPAVRALGEKIDELEDLLAGQNTGPAAAPGAAPKQNIPILDEIVEPGGQGPAEDGLDPAGPQDLAELNRRLQARLDSELEDLAEVLRGVIKKCLAEELEARSSKAGGPAADRDAGNKPPAASD